MTLLVIPFFYLFTIAWIIFIRIYARKMKSTACEKCCPIINVATTAMTATATNVILIHFISDDAPLENFIENIGISLTRRMESNTDAAGIIHELAVTAPAIL